jgi:hypothetical protein
MGHPLGKNKIPLLAGGNCGCGAFWLRSLLQGTIWNYRLRLCRADFGIGVFSGGPQFIGMHPGPRFYSRLLVNGDYVNKGRVKLSW